jgi:hypothetical protein
MKKKRKHAVRAATGPSAELLLSYTNSPRIHYKFLLEQQNWGKDKIRRLETRCSKQGFESRYYTAAIHALPLKQKLIAVIEHLIHHIARYEHSIVEMNWPSILENLHEMNNARGALFALDGRLIDVRRGARAAVRAKDNTANEVIATARRLSEDYVAKEGAVPKKEHLFTLVMDERMKQNLPVRRRSWFYNLLKENPIA